MLVEGFGGGLPGEGLAGAVVEGEGDDLELVDAPARQVRALRKVLPQQTVRVLVGAALSGAVRVGEVDLESGIDAELGVLDQFRAPVPRQ